MTSLTTLKHCEHRSLLMVSMYFRQKTKNPLGPCSNANPDAIDVLVSDVAMSPMSSTELALHLLDQKPGLPVVFVSGHVGAQALRNDILSVTTIAFLRKPFTPEELLVKVREVIQVSTSRTAA
jgi:FixJ family two-component response regulator